MNRLNTIISIMALCLISATGCRSVAEPKNASDSQGYTTKKYDHTGDINAISTVSIIDIKYKQSNTTDIQITAPAKIIPYVNVITEHGKLTANLDSKRMNADGIQLQPNKKIVLKVCAPNVNYFSTSGTGDIEMGKVALKDVTLLISGAGDIAIKELQCNTLETKLSGSGDVEIDRLSAVNSTLMLSGAGDIEIEKYNGNEFTALLSGAGDIKIENMTAKEVSLKLSGAGDIKISNGMAAKAEYNLSGAGDIKTWDLKVDNLSCYLSGTGNISCNAKEFSSKSKTGTGKIKNYHK